MTTGHTSPAGSAAGTAEPPPSDTTDARRAVRAALTLTALGVVFGDIGTSPLYAVQTVFTADNHAVKTSPVEVYGVISLIFWAITIVVSIKYVTFILRADNDGEGGIMALTALLQKQPLKTKRAKAILITLGIFGAALFYGDGIITPAISVLSAVEGLKVATPGLSDLVLPVAIGVLTALFLVQRRGTSRVGGVFGPIMALWFVILAAAGIREIGDNPAILKALSPTYAAAFIGEHGTVAFIALGSVVLAITGAEALYADMGHFGASPIRRAWFWLVFPALILNYLGQGALVLRTPAAVENPFYMIFPEWARIPMVFVATVATVIASQAVISGAFSVSRQAVQLGILPHLTIKQTSKREAGQIYVPGINWALFVAVLALVVGFGSSAALASAYGIAVTATFILNTILFMAVVRFIWRKPVWVVVLGAAVFLHRRGVLLRREPHQDRAWRLVADRRRRLHFHGADDVATRAGHRHPQPHRERRVAARLRHGDRRRSTAGPPRRRYRGLPQRQHRHRTARAASQRRAQPRTARGRRHRHDRIRQGPAHPASRPADRR